MSYLITGYPRSRTAWFAALCFAHGSPCCHEPNILFPTPPPDDWQGLEDNKRGAIGRALAAGYQGVAVPLSGGWNSGRLLFEIEAADFDRVLVIERPLAEAREAAIKAAKAAQLDSPFGCRDAGGMREIRGNAALLSRATSASYHHLDDLDVIEYCLRSIGIEPVAETIRAFQLLQIEQNMAKAQAALERFCARP